MLISAAAGFGKTTLVARWLDQTPGRSAWLSLDEHDGDPDVLLRYVIAAVRTVFPKFGTKVNKLLSSPAMPPPKYLADNLISELAALSKPLVLVLEDFYTIVSEPVQAIVTRMVQLLPENLHLVVSTRTDPSWPLGLWRARQWLSEIRAADLRFSKEEAQAFFVTNPSNPPSVKIQDATIDRIVEIVKTKRPDLIILTDDVYGTFTQGFVSLFAAVPENTIGVYSYSKYFGGTGWRLGVIALCEGNVLDKMLKDLPQADKDELSERYSSITLEPENLKMIDRMVADSRAVALNHTAGLSTPQQVFMSLFCLMDTKDAYKKAAQDLVTRRYNNLYEALGIPQPADPNAAHYYTEIDMRQVAVAAYSQELADWIDKNVHPLDFVFRLADEEEVVLMPGGGFDAPKISVRDSLANLDDAAYTAIGKRTRELVDEYYQRWKAAQEKK